MDQIHLAHRYRNELIAIERRRREAVEAIVARFAPDLAALRLATEDAGRAVLALEDALKGRSRQDRSRAQPNLAERRELRAARLSHSRAGAEHRARRREIFETPGPVLQGELQDNDHVARDSARAARASAGLYWGTYLLIEQSLGGIRSGAPPEFRRWTGEGAVAVQLQGGLDWARSLVDPDQRLRVRVLSVAGRLAVNRRGDPLPVADPRSHRSLSKGRAIAWVRVGTNPDRSPAWCTALFHLHRRPPPDSVIKWAYLHRSIVGRAVRWEVQFVLAREDWDRDDWADGGTVGIDVNWRSLPEGLRIAYAVGDDDRDHVLFLPRDWLDCWRRCETLQGTRDDNFNRIRGRFAEWLGDHDDLLPGWIREEAAHLHQWRSIDRLTRLVWRWRGPEARFEGDAGIYDEMERWRAHDRHLHDWQDHQLRQVIRRRDDLYRKFARNLARSYRIANIEDINWTKIKTLPTPDEPDDSIARVYNRIAAPGRFARFVREAFAATARVPAAGTTQRCHSCGNIDKFDSKNDLFHTCSRCMARWDQDRNAALNLRDSGEGPLAGEVDGIDDAVA